MTDAELCGLVVNVAIITGIVFLAISVLLFFRLKIIKVIGDLTGRNARQGVKRSKAEVKKRKEQELEFAKRRQAIARSNEAKVSGKLAKTEEIMDQTTVLTSQDTVVLEPTADLSRKHTEMLGSQDTEVLSQTSQLDEPMDNGLVIEDDVTVVNTDVIIE